MPVIDETEATREIKAFRREVLAEIEALKKRLEKLEASKGK